MNVRKFCGCFSQDQILQSTGYCPLHEKPYTYVCLQQQPQCKSSPLLCPLCLQPHHDHKFQTLTSYFSQQLKHSLKQGTSSNGPSVSRLSDHVKSDINKMKGVLLNQIQRVSNTINKQIQQLKSKYPQKDRFNIPGTQINPQNIGMLMTIAQAQNNRVWVPASQKYIRNLLGQVTIMISNLLYDLDQHISDQKWQQFDDYKSQIKIQQFIKKYQSQYDPQRHYFKFSSMDKHYNIKVTDESLQAQYTDSNPSKPAIITINPFTKRHDTIHFLMTKVKTTLKLFDSSLILVGAALPDTAKIFGFRNLLQPAHGGYMIGSNGKCYHSSMMKYDKKALAFSFTQNDVVRVRLDYNNRTINFSKWGFFEHQFQMQLDLPDNDIFNLRPVVLFHGQKGAVCHIVDQTYYKGKKKQQQVI